MVAYLITLRLLVVWSFDPPEAFSDARGSCQTKASFSSFVFPRDRRSSDCTKQCIMHGLMFASDTEGQISQPAPQISTPPKENQVPNASSEALALFYELSRVCISVVLSPTICPKGIKGIQIQRRVAMLGFGISAEYFH